MKNLLTLTVILYSLIFSSVSFGEWTEIGSTSLGHTFYIDLDRIREQGDFRYYWRLRDSLEPDEYGTLSTIMYRVADCLQYRDKPLQVHYYLQNMGENIDSSATDLIEQWVYPIPETIGESSLKLVCEK